MLDLNLPSLIHLDRMTDPTGLIQHGIYSLPRRESGYTTDDNARALRFCVRYWELQPIDANLSRVACYLSFLEHARCRVRGFHNFMGYQRDWLDAAGTGDCQGQAVLALAEVLASNLPDGFRALARELLKDSLSAISELRSLRAQAYIIQAWSLLASGKAQEIDKLGNIAFLAAKRLVECNHRSLRNDWPWYESNLTYANAVLPHALFEASLLWPEVDEFIDIAKSTFHFLNDVTTTDDYFTPIGNCDWYAHGEAKSLYDQQPVEASTMAAAALSAFRVTRNEDYVQIFQRAWEWFHGANSRELPLVDHADGSCFDGLTVTGLNRNQGAESTLAYLWTALLKLEIDELTHTHRTVLERSIC